MSALRERQLVPSAAVDKMLKERPPEAIRALAAHGSPVAIAAASRLGQLHADKAALADLLSPGQKRWVADGCAVVVEDDFAWPVTVARGPELARAIADAHNALLGVSPEAIKRLAAGTLRPDELVYCERCEADQKPHVHGRPRCAP